jgi:hypothetical protein
MRALRVLAGAGVSVVLAAGCTGGSGAAPSASTSASASVSTLPSPSVTPSATASVPAAARAHTKAGAEAFVRFYVGQTNVAWTVPSTSVLPPLSDEGCKSCDSLQSTARDLQSKGQRYVSDPVSIVDVAAFSGAAAGRQYVRARLQQHTVNVVDGAGRVVLTDPAKALTRTVEVTWKEGRWLLYDMAEG